MRDDGRGSISTWLRRVDLAAAAVLAAVAVLPVAVSPNGKLMFVGSYPAPWWVKLAFILPIAIVLVVGRLSGPWVSVVLRLLVIPIVAFSAFTLEWSYAKTDEETIVGAWGGTPMYLIVGIQVVSIVRTVVLGIRGKHAA